MAKKISIETAEVGGLRSMNISGLNQDKLRAARKGGLRDAIDIAPDGKGGHIILDGTHTAYVASHQGKSLQANVWEEGDQPGDPLVRLNLKRARRFSETTELLGRGRIKDLSVDES